MKEQIEGNKLTLEDFKHDYSRLIIRYDNNTERHNAIQNHILNNYDHIKSQITEWMKEN